jgi:hypothetical protein
LQLSSNKTAALASTGKQDMAFPDLEFTAAFPPSFRPATLELSGHRLPTAASSHSWLGD